MAGVDVSQGQGPRVSVIMPTFDRAPFLPRAIGSLLVQSLSDWELVIIDDGSGDRTPTLVAAYLDDPRISFERWPRNRGLGAAANRGLDRAAAPLVAYLPADDLYYPDHLAALLACFTGEETDDAVVLAWAGMRHKGGATTLDPLPGHGLQLVQVMHRLTGDRWVERDELESDDLDRLFWEKVRRRGRGVATGRVTCEWVDHPDQRHKHARESYDGGLNVFRRRWLARTDLFSDLGYPLVLAASNKIFLGRLLGLELHERNIATAAACSLGILLGARVIRVHDARLGRQVADLTAAVLERRGDR